MQTTRAPSASVSLGNRNCGFRSEDAADVLGNTRARTALMELNAAFSSPASLTAKYGEPLHRFPHEPITFHPTTAELERMLENMGVSAAERKAQVRQLLNAMRVFLVVCLCDGVSQSVRLRIGALTFNTLIFFRCPSCAS